MFYAIMLALLAALCFAFVWSSERSAFVSILVTVAGIAFALGAILIAMNYIAQVRDAHVYRERRNLTITPENEYIRLITQMNSEQAEIWFKRQVALVGIPGVASAELYYQVDGDLIPAAFVQKWLSLCDHEQLAPKRNFSDGHEYEWADKMTAFYINRGLAYPHIKGSGKAATWKPGIHLESALQWFHLSEV